MLLLPHRLGVQYWLSIVPDIGFPPQWGWESGTGGDGAAYQCFLGSCGPITTNDLAFTLLGAAVSNTPEPSSLFMLGADCSDWPDGNGPTTEAGRRQSRPSYRAKGRHERNEDLYWTQNMRRRGACCGALSAFTGGVIVANLTMKWRSLPGVILGFRFHQQYGFSGLGSPGRGSTTFRGLLNEPAYPVVVRAPNRFLSSVSSSGLQRKARAAA